jgi:hypothetical protein
LRQLYSLVRSRPLQRAFHRGDAQIQRSGGFRRRPTEHIPQQQHRALPGRQMLGGHEKRQLDGLLGHHHRVWSGFARRDRLQQLVWERLQPPDLRRLPGSARCRLAGVPIEEVETGVRCDPIQPRSHRRTALEADPAAPRPQERLLNQVLRVIE